MFARTIDRIRSSLRRLSPGLALALLASCAELPHEPPPAPQGFLPDTIARAGAAPLVVGVLIGRWHSGLVLPARELGPLTPLLRPGPQGRYLAFNWGNRRFYMSAHPDSADALAALFRSPSVLLIEAAPAAADLASEADASVRWLCVTRSELWKIDIYLEDSFARRAGRPIDLGAGPLAQSTFYASTGHYDAFHTCNTWTLAALEYAGLPASAGGAIFADQVGARIAPLRVCAVRR